MTLSPLRLAFMGTPGFAVPALEALIASPHQIVVVYTQPPRPAGRGHKLQKSAVHQLAETHGIDVRHPESLKPQEAKDEFAALNLDCAIVAAYGLILPPAILTAPKHGCLNIHGSLLPRWRGAAPIHRAILAGDSQTGITIMVMEAGLDTGPMLLKDSLPITAASTTVTIHDELAAMGARLILPALEGFVSGRIKPEAQPADGVTYADKLTRAEGRLDFSKPAADLDRQIRALVPWPGAFFDWQGEVIKVGAAIIAQGSGKPGEILDRDLTIACGAGALTLTQLQRPGKSWQDGAAFLRGFGAKTGDIVT